MRISLGLLLLVLGGCPHPVPPPQPPPVPQCGLDDAAYDTLNNDVVTALDDDNLWSEKLTLLSSQSTKPTVICVLQNIRADVRDAPTTLSRIDEWLAKNDTTKKESR